MASTIAPSEEERRELYNLANNVPFDDCVDQQLREALRYIQNSVIEETIVKRPDVAEAERHFNYPYAAVEESLSNAVYHKGYDSREPIEVRVLPDRIEILSHPGADRSITIENLMQYRAVSRRYRNRRVGDFLKELHLTEGRNTGFRKILHALKANGSPAPRFETDEDRIYFLTTLFAWRPSDRAKSADEHAGRRYAGAAGIADRRERVLDYFAEHPEATLLELCAALGITKSMADRDVKALKQDGRIKREGSSFAGYWKVLD